MGIVQLIFISTITITTFAISILTGKIFSIGLNLTAIQSRWVMVASVLGPLLFVGTMVIGRVWQNPLLNSLSYLINAIGGIIFYLFIFGFVLGLILLAGKIFNFSVPVLVAYILLTAGFVFGLAGLVQAKFIKVTTYNITISGAPESWNNKTAVLVSDTHLGLINHKKFSDKVVNKILDINPDFVMHAGDFYDGPANDTKIITESWKKLTDSIPVFYAPGNHEEYGDYEGFLASIRNAGVTTLVDEVAEYDGVQIAGITYMDKKLTEVADKIIKNLKLNNAKASILINHHPVFRKSAEEVGIDLMVSGHTHKGQFWPFYYVVKAIYGKYIYGVNIDNTITTITTSGVGTAGPPMRLFNTPELVLIKFKTN